jgi:hypothetical protein
MTACCIPYVQYTVYVKAMTVYVEYTHEDVDNKMYVFFISLYYDIYTAYVVQCRIYTRCFFHFPMQQWQRVVYSIYVKAMNVYVQ